MAGAGDHLQPPEALGQPVADLAGSLDRRDRVQLAHADQGGAVDSGELVHDVEAPEQLHTMLAQLWVPDPAGQLGRPGHVGSEHRENARPLLVGHRAPAVVALGQLGNLVAAEAAETLHQPRQIPAGVRRLEHQGGRVARVARPVQHGHEAAHRVAVDHRPDDADRVAEGAQVVGAHLEAPVRRVAPRRPAMSPQVQIDHLRLGGQPAEVRLEIGVVVAAGAAVHQHHGRPPPHSRTLRDERRALHVEPQPRRVHLDVHSGLPSSAGLPAHRRQPTARPQSMSGSGWSPCWRTSSPCGFGMPRALFPQVAQRMSAARPQRRGSRSGRSMPRCREERS
jgi:hypothetical protein